MNARHTEFLGPDLGRGPFSSQRLETSALQIATALAQLRAPLGRAADDLRGHVDFIRELADRLAPDYATTLALDVGPAGPTVATTIRAPAGMYSLLDCWLADSPGGGVTTTSPTSVTISAGIILHTLYTPRHYLILAPTNGVVSLSVGHTANKTWYWAASRGGRVQYSSAVHIEAAPPP